MSWTEDSWWSDTRRPLVDARALQPEAYFSTEFFDDERRRVFERGWICVGVTDEVALRGRMLVRRVGGRSILITRDATDVLRGFVNACRHRGTELAEADCDVANTIRCPYHRWGYGLNGTLKSTPFFDEVARLEFDRADHGLVPVRVESWGGLLFACLSTGTAPLDAWLGDLTERFAGYSLASWAACHQQDLDIRANWKLISENFQEYYHLTWVHPELAKVSRVADHYRYQGPGMYCGQTTTPVTGTERDDWLALPPAPNLDESDASSGRFVAIFPNVLVSVLPNHAWVMRLEPLAPGLTRETCTMLVPPTSNDTRGHATASTRDFWLDVNGEDIDIVERGQRGVEFGAAPPGPLAPRFEEPLHRFHNMLADCMTLGDLGALRIPPGDDPSSPDDRWGTTPNPCPARIDRP